MPDPHKPQPISLPKYIKPELQKYRIDPENQERIEKYIQKRDRVDDLLRKEHDVVRAKNKILSRYENEVSNKITVTPEVAKLAALIERDCKTVLPTMLKTHTVLCRRILSDQNAPAMFKGQSRTDRKSTRNQKMQDQFDQILSLAGFIARKGNSISTMPRKIHMINNLSSYIIFPIDGFNFTTMQNPNIYKISDIFDIYEDIESFITQDRLNFKELKYLYNEITTSGSPLNLNSFIISKEGNSFVMLVKDTISRINSKKPISKSRIEELKKGMTLLLHSKDYSSWGFGQYEMKHIIQDLTLYCYIYEVLSDSDIAKKFAIENGMFNDNFEKALNVRSEVLINGQYYAVDYDQNGLSLLYTLGFENFA